MNQLAKLYPEGWLRYCPECREYIDQSAPLNDSRRKTVIIDDVACNKCIEDAQAIMGRLGVPKENSDDVS